MRPGRLDRILYVAPPGKEARVEIFKVNFKKMAVNDDVDIERLADMVSMVVWGNLGAYNADGYALGLSQTEGCSGAEIVAICQDAAFNAMNEDLDALDVSVSICRNARHLGRAGADATPCPSTPDPHEAPRVGW